MPAMATATPQLSSGMIIAMGSAPGAFGNQMALRAHKTCGAALRSAESLSFSLCGGPRLPRLWPQSTGRPAATTQSRSMIRSCGRPGARVGRLLLLRRRSLLGTKALSRVSADRRGRSTRDGPKRNTRCATQTRSSQETPAAWGEPGGGMVRDPGEGGRGDTGSPRAAEAVPRADPRRTQPRGPGACPLGGCGRCPGAGGPEPPASTRCPVRGHGRA